MERGVTRERRGHCPRGDPRCVNQIGNSRLRTTKPRPELSPLGVKPSAPGAAFTAKLVLVRYGRLSPIKRSRKGENVQVRLVWARNVSSHPEAPELLTHSMRARQGAPSDQTLVRAATQPLRGDQPGRSVYMERTRGQSRTKVPEMNAGCLCREIEQQKGRVGPKRKARK